MPRAAPRAGASSLGYPGDVRAARRSHERVSRLPRKHAPQHEGGKLCFGHPGLPGQGREASPDVSAKIHLLPLIFPLRQRRPMRPDAESRGQRPRLRQVRPLVRGSVSQQHRRLGRRAVYGRRRSLQIQGQRERLVALWVRMFPGHTCFHSTTPPWKTCVPKFPLVRGIGPSFLVDPGHAQSCKLANRDHPGLLGSAFGHLESGFPARVRQPRVSGNAVRSRAPAGREVKFSLRVYLAGFGRATPDGRM